MNRAGQGGRNGLLNVAYLTRRSSGEGARGGSGGFFSSLVHSGNPQPLVGWDRRRIHRITGRTMIQRTLGLLGSERGVGDCSLSRVCLRSNGHETGAREALRTVRVRLPRRGLPRPSVDVRA